MSDDRADPPVASENPAPALLAGGAGLDEIRSHASGCTACHLYARATQTVFGDGPTKATVLFVGEQPGDEEDRDGEPFVGPAGRLLDTALEMAGIDRSATYVTNVVKHFKWKPAPRGKRRIHDSPNRTEVVACRPWFDAELALVDPEVVVCLGAVAAKALLGNSIRVTRDRGQWFELDGRRALVTVHPSSVLRSRGSEDRAANMAAFVEDLRLAASAS